MFLSFLTSYVDSDVVMAHCQLLTTYNHNTQAENEAAFTFMYHLTIDTPDLAHLLYNIPLFTTFANIWAEDDEVNTISEVSTPSPCPI